MDWTTADPTLYQPPATTRDPSYVARAFLEGVLGLEESTTHLDPLVTPRSRAAWGDFRRAQRHLQLLPGVALSSKHSRPAGARDVAYVSLFVGVETGYVVPAGTPMLPEAVVTLVWHNDVDSWLVHAAGDAVPPEVLERHSIGQAPEES
jgi:hypothetical protein